MGKKLGFFKRLEAASMVLRGQGVPAFWFARAIEIGSQEVLQEPYKSSVWVQAAIKKIAGPISSVPVNFYSTRTAKKRGKGYRKRDDDQTVDLPEMDALLRAPMQNLGYSDFCEATVGWLKMSGECFWLLDDSMLVPFPEARGRALPQVIVARPDRMRHVIENNQLKGWSYNDPSGGMHSLLPEQVIQLKYWNPYNPWRGLSEYEATLIAAESDWLAGKFARNLMANNGDTGPYIVAKNGIPTDPQREQILADLRAKRAAQQRGDFRPIFLTGDITVEDPQVRSVDAAFIAQRLENRHEIFIGFGVPPSMADVKAAYSIGSASDYYQLIANTCIPTGGKLADGIKRLTVKLQRADVDVELDWDEHPVMQEVRKERLASVEVLWSKGMPMQEINEYLGLELPEFDGWEVGYLPFSVSPVGSEELEMAQSPSENPDLAEPIADQPKAVREMLGALRETKAAALADLTRANKKAIWEAHMRKRAGTIKTYQGKASRVINEFRGKVLNKWAQYESAHAKQMVQRSVIDFIFDAAEFGNALRVVMNPVSQAALQTAGEQLFEEIGRSDPWKMPPHKALEFVASRNGALKGVGETVRGQLNTVLETGFKEGTSIEKMTDEIRGVFNNLAKYEAKRIAMTETSVAFGFARDAAMRSAGVEQKMWLSSHGETVRPAHAAAEDDYGESPIPIDEPFVVDGEKLMYPGDPNGSAENVINCHCVSIAAAPADEI